MSVPHLDTREITGKRELLFGPFAGFTTKFLKKGSYWDLLSSIKPGNFIPLIRAGMNNLSLTRYLINQAMQAPEDRLSTLLDYYPNAHILDWDLEIAGKRVQVIKKDPIHGGILEFGTEVVTSQDGSIAALLGASPGASTAAAIMIDLLHICFPDKTSSAEWQTKLEYIIPSYGKSFGENPELLNNLRLRTERALKMGAAFDFQHTQS